MKKAKFILSLVFVVSILFVQVGGVFAAPAIPNSAPVTGVIQSITLETDATTGVTIVIVHLIDHNQSLQSVRLNQKTALTLGLVVLNGDGKPGINPRALGRPVEIDPKNVIPDQEENQHPVGSALATFFSDIAGIDYETVMTAHEQGVGFGVIAQALWLTTKLEGNAETFRLLIQAKQSGDYSAFVLTDGSTPKSWGQLKKAILDKDKDNSVGVVMSSSNNNGNGNGQGNNGNGNNHGNGNSNGNGNGNGNGGGNGNGNGNGNGGNNGGGNDKEK